MTLPLVGPLLDNKILILILISKMNMKNKDYIYFCVDKLSEAQRCFL